MSISKELWFAFMCLPGQFPWQCVIDHFDPPQLPPPVSKNNYQTISVSVKRFPIHEQWTHMTGFSLYGNMCIQQNMFEFQNELTLRCETTTLSKFCLKYKKKKNGCTWPPSPCTVWWGHSSEKWLDIKVIQKGQEQTEVLYLSQTSGGRQIKH